MLGIVSLIGETLSAATAYAADRSPARAQALEVCIGFLLIGSFALIGAALPAVL